ncbi:MAG: hypothetical protein IPM29_18450 [Planctomycetes bacterium]|nr:hypothetical protein [Planctomycetota bacterium]
MSPRILALIAALSLASASSAQALEARIELESGRVLFAEVVELNADEIQVVVDGRELRLPRAAVASIVPVGADPGPPARSAAALDDQQDASGTEGGDVVAGSPAGGARQQPGREPASGATASRAGGPDERVVDLIERFLWVVPEGGAGHLTSLGAALLLMSSFLVLLSARLAGLERVTFARCAGLSVVLLAVLAVEASLLPATAIAVGIALLADLVVFVLCTNLILGASLGASGFVVAAFAFAMLLGVLLTELVGVLISAHDLL